ncbi:MAG: class I SAM-dependent RNA methyltransferase [Acidimicrobiales bacterium]
MTSSPVALVLSGGIAAGGDGIGRLEDGRIVFVEGALPGERVAAVMTAERRDYARARTIEVVDPSPDRVAPPCPWVRRGCGGCAWQHVVAGAQPRLKERIVADALRRIGRVRGPVEFWPASQLRPGGYRTTAHLGVTPAGALAYRRRHHHDLVEIDRCLVAHPRLDELISTVCAPGHEQLTLRVGVAGGERLAVLGGHPASAVGAPADVTVVAPGASAFLHEDAGGRRWRVSARVFFQSGPQGASALADAVDSAAGDAAAPGATVVDAYAGVGLLGGTVVGRRGGRLVSIESRADAADDARINLADLDAEVVTGEVAAWRREGPVDLVIADPARPGLGRPGVAALAGAGAPRLVLVACDPASLGRDTALLEAAGYHLGPVRLVDQFPHTPHVEAVARFDR